MCISSLPYNNQIFQDYLCIHMYDLIMFLTPGVFLLIEVVNET